MSYPMNALLSDPDMQAVPIALVRAIRDRLDYSRWLVGAGFSPRHRACWSRAEARSYGIIRNVSDGVY